MGKVTRQIFEDNTKAWSGDHCIDPRLVPGVLFSSHKFIEDKPAIVDVAPTILKLLASPCLRISTANRGRWLLRRAIVKAVGGL